MVNIRESMGLLGLRVKDRVTGFKGVVSSIAFDLYGCVQAVVNPGMGKDGKLGDSAWHDVARLQVIDKKPVMPVPDFEYKKGPAEKPAIMKP